MSVCIWMKEFIYDIKLYIYIYIWHTLYTGYTHLRVHLSTYIYNMYVARSVVLSLVGGTEPHKFHTCIHRNLRRWKNIMCLVNFIFLTFNAQNLLSPNPLILTHRTPGVRLNPRLRTTELGEITPLIYLYIYIYNMYVAMWNNSFNLPIYIYIQYVCSQVKSSTIYYARLDLHKVRGYYLPG